MAITETEQTEGTTRLPWYVRDNYAPVLDEVEAYDLEIEGTVPEHLDGLYVRNGANPKGAVPMHWFLGDGMLHGIRLNGGRAEWYRNRYVRTKVHGGVDRMAPESMLDRSISTANTHVLAHGGRILALEEGAFPTVVTPELDTVGSFDFGGKLATAFTAHPKICPETGELLAFGYGVFDPYLVYHRIDAAGALVQSEPIEVPGSTMMHDFAATRSHVIFMDLPVVFDLEAAMRGEMPYGWSESYGARMGVMPRTGTNADVRWFDVDPCFVFHTMNAYEDDKGRVVLDAGRHASMWRGGADVFEPCYLWRWTMDPATGTVTEQQLDDVDHAFPRIDDRRSGLSYRYGWATAPRAKARAGDMNGDTVIVKYDVLTGERSVFDPGPGRMFGEPVFVPAGPGASEDEGHVMTYVYDREANTSSFIVLDAQDLSRPATATVALPQRVPHGFHGSWVRA